MLEVSTPAWICAGEHGCDTPLPAPPMRLPAARPPQWREGYGERFGIVHVAFGTPGLKRTVKDSGKFMSQFFRAEA